MGEGEFWSETWTKEAKKDSEYAMRFLDRASDKLEQARTAISGEAVETAVKAQLDEFEDGLERARQAISEIEWRS